MDVVILLLFAGLIVFAYLLHIICGIEKKTHKYDSNLRAEYSCRVELYWLGCSTCLGIS